MFSMIVSCTPAPEDIESVKQSAPRALAEARRQLGVRSDVQARLFSGLEAPSDAGLRPAQAEWIITRSQAHFHASWVSRSDMRNSLVLPQSDSCRAEPQPMRNPGSRQIPYSGLGDARRAASVR